MTTKEDLSGALPDVTSTYHFAGLGAPVEIYRDTFGVPHIRAGSEKDAFFTQGFVTAQDRLWHMEYDRRRGSGRWAEVVGVTGLAQDKLMRRFRLAAAAKADYQAVGPQTKVMFDAYAAGVNAFIDNSGTLPVEYWITGLKPEPWLPWDGLIAYKVRHIFMGVFESKLWRARLVRELGPEKAARLFPGYQPGHLLILPPGAVHSGPLDYGLDELCQGAAALNYLTDTDGGSNSWVLAGDRTATGKPILAGDSHRALDTPNAYYQNHLSCPEFDVTGLSFPGVPAFPHFGHNEWVAWSVTHTSADYQDLYIERFNPDQSGSYLYQDEWKPAEVFHEKIGVKGGQDVDLDVWVTHHGPLISGSPEQGAGLSFKYIATDQPSAWADILWQMLRSKDAEQLVESQRDWVDPCNNFLLADVHGNSGYLCRGRIPVRSRANAWLPVPGWTGEHEWQGQIPFEELPRSMNPNEGYIATANNRPVGDDYPYYIGVDFVPEFRAKRVTEGLLSLSKPNMPNASDMAVVHGQKVSITAETYIELLKSVEPQDEMSAEAKERLLGWSGSMDLNLVEPTIYSACRDQMLKEIFQQNLTPKLAEDACRPANRGTSTFVNRMKAQMAAMIQSDDRTLLPPGEDWASMMARGLSKGVEALSALLGPDMSQWRWERVHQARPKHPLSVSKPELSPFLNPPAIPSGGDWDTPLAGAYSAANPATITTLSVARYSYDLADWDDSLWVVPLGSSGHPGSKHYHDQSAAWSQVQMVPMVYSWERIIAESETQQRLEPA
jgi:penicillin amidase